MTKRKKSQLTERGNYCRIMSIVSMVVAISSLLIALLILVGGTHEPSIPYELRQEPDPTTAIWFILIALGGIFNYLRLDHERNNIEQELWSN